ncbi:MAG: DNA cytosine methyltransferase [Methanobacterium sp.]
MNDSKIKAIDLFCGAGGSSFGATQAGVEVVAGFDMWNLAIKAYKTNFPETKVFQGDLRNLSSEKIRSIKSEIGNIDLILASPECTNHSRAKGAVERDEASKDTAFEVIRFAKEFTPPWIIIENVVEMQSWNKYKDLLEKLWDLKYFVRKVVLNAKDFGVPQSRERLFLLCSLSGKTNVPSANPEIIKPVSDVIDNTGKYKSNLLRKKGRAENTIQSAERAIAELGVNTPFLLVYYGSGRKGNGGWQKITQPLGTITTLDRFAYAFHENNSLMMRMLQPEELKHAMGYNDKYKLDSIEGLTRRDRIKLMGNGVCPPVMNAIVRSLITNEKI